MGDKLLAVVELSPNAGPISLHQTGDQVVFLAENGSGVLTREQVKQAIQTLKGYVDNLERFLEDTSGAHPTLKALATVQFEPETAGGYEVDELSVTLDEDEESEGGWALDVAVVYAHGDAPEHPYLVNQRLVVKGGKLCTDYGTALADINDLEACRRGLAEHFTYDGG